MKSCMVAVYTVCVLMLSLYWPGMYMILNTEMKKKLHYQKLHWHIYITYHGINYELLEDYTTVSKHVGAA